MSGLDLAEVHPGDVLTVQDKARNVVICPVAVVSDVLAIELFGSYVVIAQRNRAGNLSVVPGVKITGHQTSLFDEEPPA